MKGKFGLSVIRPNKQKERVRMKSLSRLVCLLLLSLSVLAAQPPSTVPDLLAEADAMYWFAQAEGGDMKMLKRGFDALDRADALLASQPTGPQRDKLVAASTALRTELTEQEIMAHDTVNGTLPLFRYFIFRDSVSEWVDDPMVITAVRGARGVAATASAHWKPYPQLDVVYGSQGRDRSGKGRGLVASPTQENEMAYVFNLDGRFFNHHRGELAAVLDPGQLSSYDSSGLDGATATTLARAWGIERLLEVRIKELFVDSPWWFYVATAKLFSAADGAIEATVNSFGMVRDQRAKLPWLLLVVLPAVLAALGAAVFCHRAWLQALVAALVSFVASTAFVIGVGPWIPPGDYLLTISWWAPAAVALTLLCVLPLVVYAVSWRFSAVAAWFFGSSARTAASAVGLGAGVGGLATFAALTVLEPAQAVVLAVLSVPAFGSISARLFEIVRTGKSETQLADALPPLAAFAFFGWVFWMIPAEDRSASSLMTAALPVALAVLALGGLLFTRLASFTGLAVFSIGAFGAMMTGQPAQVALFALVGLVLIALKDKNSPSVVPRRSSASKSEKHGWSDIFSNCSENWPLARVAPLARVEEVLAQASAKSAAGCVSIVEIRGQAGTGKTRMVGEAIAARGWRLYRGTCRAGQPFAFLQEAVQRAGAGSLAALGNPQEGSAAVEIGTKLVSSVPVLGTLCDWIAPSGHGQANITPENLASEFLSLVEAAGRLSQDPPVLWIDEAEYLGEDGRALVNALADNARTRRQNLVIVLSGRRVPGDLDAEHKLSLEWNEGDRLATLQPVLAEDSARALVSANPGLVAGSYVAWVQHLWHCGSLEERGGKLCIKGGDSSCYEVPRSVVEAAGKTLEDLDPPVFEALQAAAVDGVHFHVTALAQATGLPMRELLRHLEHAEQWGIVEDLAEDEVFAFRNSPVREYLVSTLRHGADGAYRQRYHSWNLGLADAYASFGEDRFLPEAALHAREAGSSYLVKAVAICQRAAKFSLARGQWQQAADHAAFVVDHGAKEEAAEAGIVYLRANWLMRRDPADKQMATRINALRDCLGNEVKTDTRTLLACEIVRTLWPSPWNPSSADVSAPRLLEELLPDLDAAKIRVLHFRGASLHKLAGKEDTEARRKALALLREAVGLAASGEDARQERAEALNTLAEIALQLGEEDQVAKALEESISIKKSTGDKQGLAISYGSLGRFHLFRRDRTPDDMQKATAAFGEDLEISREIGDTSGQVSMLSFLALCYLESGDAVRALDSFRQSRDAAAALGQKRNEAFAMCGMARAMAAIKSSELQRELTKLREMVAALGEHDREALKHALEKVREACRGAGIRFEA
jgi:tetratricopeptide (TPR) repeat protein